MLLLDHSKNLKNFNLFSPFSCYLKCFYCAIVWPSLELSYHWILLNWIFFFLWFLWFSWIFPFDPSLVTHFYVKVVTCLMTPDSCSRKKRWGLLNFQNSGPNSPTFITNSLSLLTAEESFLSSIPILVPGFSWNLRCDWTFKELQHCLNHKVLWHLQPF